MEQITFLFSSCFIHLFPFCRVIFLPFHDPIVDQCQLLQEKKKIIFPLLTRNLKDDLFTMLSKLQSYFNLFFPSEIRKKIWVRRYASKPFHVCAMRIWGWKRALGVIEASATILQFRKPKPTVAMLSDWSRLWQVESR